MFYIHRGRLGNIMFQYACMYELANFYGAELIIDDEMAKNLSMFTLLSSRHTIQRYCQIDQIERIANRVKSYDARKKLIDLFNITDISRIFDWFENYRIFDHDTEEIKSLYTFKEHILNKAGRRLHDIRKKESSHSNVTLVGVHMRRKDRNRTDPLAFQYFLNALQYFRNKYYNAHFVVASDDHTYAVSQFNHTGDVTVLPLEAGFDGVAADLASLTLCDHMIISVGTFGFWAGWLGKGEVVFPDSSYYRTKCPVPAYWIPIKNH